MPCSGGDPNRIRTGVAAVRGRSTRPLYDGAAGVPGLEPRMTVPETVVLPITPYPTTHKGFGLPHSCQYPRATRCNYTYLRQTQQIMQPRHVAAQPPQTRFTLRCVSAPATAPLAQLNAATRSPYPEFPWIQTAAEKPAVRIPQHGPVQKPDAA